MIATNAPISRVLLHVRLSLPWPPPMPSAPLLNWLTIRPRFSCLHCCRFRLFLGRFHRRHRRRLSIGRVNWFPCEHLNLLLFLVAADYEASALRLPTVHSLAALGSVARWPPAVAPARAALLIRARPPLPAGARSSAPGLRGRPTREQRIVGG